MVEQGCIIRSTMSNVDAQSLSIDLALVVWLARVESTCTHLFSRSRARLIRTASSGKQEQDPRQHSDSFYCDEPSPVAASGPLRPCPRRPRSPPASRRQRPQRTPTGWRRLLLRPHQRQRSQREESCIVSGGESSTDRHSERTFPQARLAVVRGRREDGARHVPLELGDTRTEV